MLTASPANGSPDWAKELASDLGGLAAIARRAATPDATAVESTAGQASEPNGSLTLLQSLLVEMRGLRAAVDRQAEHEGRLARLVAAEVPILLDGDDLAGCLGLSRRELDRMRCTGDVPKPDVILGRSPRWKPETVRKAIDNLAKGNRR